MSSTDLAREQLHFAIQALRDIMVSDPDGEAGELAGRALGAIASRRMGLSTAIRAKPDWLPVVIPDLPSNSVGWAKWVFNVYSGESNGWAFDGPFLKRGRSEALPPGAIVIVYHRPHGTDRKSYAQASVTVLVLEDTGQFRVEMGSHGKTWARPLVEPIAKLLGRSASERAQPLIWAGHGHLTFNFPPSI